MLIKTGLAEFKRRRQALMNCMAENSMAMIPAASLIIRNRYVTHPFRQDSDFFYLTGLEEPDSLLVLIPGREAGQVLLFCPQL